MDFKFKVKENCIVLKESVYTHRNIAVCNYIIYFKVLFSYILIKNSCGNYAN